MRRFFGLALLATGALLASGCAAHPSQVATEPAVATAPARAQSFSSPLELSGTLSAVRNVTLGAAAAGRIVAVNVRVGDHVRAGEALAQVDATAYGAQLAGAQAGAAAALDGQRAAAAQLAQAESHLRLAQTTAARMSSLYAQGAISKQQQDETQANLAAARAGLAQAQAGLSAAQGVSAQARAGVTAAAVPLANTTITAPFDGVVTQKFVEPGAVVGPGSPVVAVQNTSDLELDVALPEDQVAALVPGMPLTVRVDALGGASLPARVRAVVPSADPSLRSVTLRINVAPRTGLLPGMFARVAIPGVATPGTGVPLAALVTRAGQSGVFVIRDGVATFVPVQSGVVTPTAVQVHGIRAGAEVAVSNLAQLTDGARVSVTKQ